MFPDDVPVLQPALTTDSLPVHAARLAATDAGLAAILRQYGPPPLWAREAGFPTLVHLILEQQVSLASARAAFDRLVAAANPLTPQAFLVLDDDQLLAIGFSRQKTRYARALAEALLAGRLDLAALADLPDDAVDRQLTALPGIGPWTASIYRLMVLLRPDAWPAHDIALAQSVAEMRGLAVRPSPEALATIGDAWRPYRAVAARMLWHRYLSVRAERQTRP